MAQITTIHQSTQGYESWLSNQIPIVVADLRAKHERMADDPFSFLRSTFYRWMQLFPEICPTLGRAPRVLAVGDLHVENFGSWRDAEGRLVWGINDFDEAYPLPYTVDLVRLVTSAWLAIDVHHLDLDPADACSAIRDGYQSGMTAGGLSFVLSERNSWLRLAVTSIERDPVEFWDRLSALKPCRGVPRTAVARLKHAMPEPGLKFQIAHRRAGLGSLGKERYTAIAEWRGGLIAREVKRLAPSACAWAKSESSPAIYYTDLLERAIRTPDPFLTVEGEWVCRRLSPYCSRIELTQLAKRGDDLQLLHAMGSELANIHLGTRRATRAILTDLANRKPKWLTQAAELMVDVTMSDWKNWRKRRA